MKPIEKRGKDASALRQQLPPVSPKIGLNPKTNITLAPITLENK
jgi:hypothetical protein